MIEWAMLLVDDLIVFIWQAWRHNIYWAIMVVLYTVGTPMAWD